MPSPQRPGPSPQLSGASTHPPHPPDGQPSYSTQPQDPHHHHWPKPKAEALPESPLQGCPSSSASFRDPSSQYCLFSIFRHPSGPAPYHLHLYLFKSPDLRQKTSVPVSSPPSYCLFFLFSAKFPGKGPLPMPSLFPCLLALSSGQAGCPPPFCSSPAIWGFSPAQAITNLDSILKSRDITLPTKIHLVKAMVFPVVMHGCESWTVKKAECQRIDAFELWCWKRLLSPLDCKEIPSPS